MAERTEGGLSSCQGKGAGWWSQRKMTQSKIESAKQLLASGTLLKGCRT
ncbi:hypothetical protein PGH45_19380 [Legionella pneumophila]|nr:hypothetical protein [Legionella pneumophila]